MMERFAARWVPVPVPPRVYGKCLGNAQKPYGGGFAASLDEFSKAWAIY
jgi:hypothetical protein